MSEQNRRAFKPLRLRLSEIEDADARMAIEMRFDEMQVRREVAVEAARKAAIADRERHAARSLKNLAPRSQLVPARSCQGPR